MSRTSASIFRDELQSVALGSRIPIVRYKPGCVLSRGMYRIAEKLLAAPAEEPDGAPWIGGSAGQRTATLRLQSRGRGGGGLQGHAPGPGGPAELRRAFHGGSRRVGEDPADRAVNAPPGKCAPPRPAPASPGSTAALTHDTAPAPRCLLASLVSPVLLAAAPAPRLVFSPAEWKFGMIIQGAVIEQELTVTNLEPSAVTVTLVPTCSCNQVVPGSQTIPGGSSRLFRCATTRPTTGESRPRASW